MAYSMRDNMPTLTVCASCDREVPASREVLIRAVEVRSGRRFFFRCPHCGHNDNVFLSWQDIDTRRKQVADQVSSAAKGKSDDSRSEQSERGWTIKEFMIDLEGVETLEDIALYWDDPLGRRYPDVPKERKVQALWSWERIDNGQEV